MSCEEANKIALSITGAILLEYNKFAKITSHETQIIQAVRIPDIESGCIISSLFAK